MSNFKLRNKYKGKIKYENMWEFEETYNKCCEILSSLQSFKVLCSMGKLNVNLIFFSTLEELEN